MRTLVLALSGWALLITSSFVAGEDKKQPERVALQSLGKKPLRILVDEQSIAIGKRKYDSSKVLMDYLASQPAATLSDGLLVEYLTKADVKEDPYDAIVAFATRRGYDVFLKTALGKRPYIEHEAFWILKAPERRGN